MKWDYRNQSDPPHQGLWVVVNLQLQGLQQPARNDDGETDFRIK
jgi:hypothetical protein